MKNAEDASPIILPLDLLQLCYGCSSSSCLMYLYHVIMEFLVNLPHSASFIRQIAIFAEVGLVQNQALLLAKPAVFPHALLTLWNVNTASVRQNRPDQVGAEIHMKHRRW
jgi:hypothetical protein